jgi:hypothetical protein
MSSPGDLLQAWRDAVGQMRDAAAPLTGPTAELARQLLGPLQRQGELVEEVLRRQAQFDKRLVGQMLAPATVLLDVLDQTAAAMRNQAKAFDLAATSFKQSAELLELQAGLMERAARTLRDPAELVRSATRPSPARPPR